MPNRVQIRAQGSDNAQVTDRVKGALSAWLREAGVGSARSELSESGVLYTHYCGGNYVSISAVGGGTAVFGDARDRAVTAHPENRVIHDACFWVGREWIADLPEFDDASGPDSEEK